MESVIRMVKGFRGKGGNLDKQVQHDELLVEVIQVFIKRLDHFE